MSLANPHPFLSHFPIVLLNCLMLLELFALFVRRVNLGTTRIVLVAAIVLTTMVAYFSGTFFALEAVADAGSIAAQIEHHQSYAKLLSFLVILLPLTLTLYASSSENSLKTRVLYLLTLSLLCGLVNYVGLLGGELVFTYGAGVDVSAL